MSIAYYTPFFKWTRTFVGAITSNNYFCDALKIVCILGSFESFDFIVQVPASFFEYVPLHMYDEYVPVPDEYFPEMGT